MSNIDSVEFILIIMFTKWNTVFFSLQNKELKNETF